MSLSNPSPGASPRNLPVAPVRKSIRVDAGAARAFEVFTANIGRWWPRTHHIGAVPMKESVMEERVGGRWYERGEDGSECEWGKVLVWEPPLRVVLAWNVTPQFKYDPTRFSEVEVRFIAESSTVTRVELEHKYLERFGGEEGAQMREKVDAPNGWAALLGLYAASAAAKE